MFRLWELSGPAHTTGYSNNYRSGMLVHAHSNGNVSTFDPEAAGAWGYQYPGGTCANYNLYFAGPIWGAALVTLDDWIRTGVAPGSQPRATRVNGERVYDEHGNLVGGVRSPLLDAPIATYYAGGVPLGSTACGAVGGTTPLTGLTQVFDPLKLATLYPSPDAYLTAFRAAVDDMLAAGAVMPEGAAEYMRRAEASGVGGPFPSI